MGLSDHRRSPPQPHPACAASSHRNSPVLATPTPRRMANLSLPWDSLTRQLDMQPHFTSHLPRGQGGCPCHAMTDHAQYSQRSAAVTTEKQKSQVTPKKRMFLPSSADSLDEREPGALVLAGKV